PFFSTKQESKGVGLGLSVAYGIVQQHCGKLELTSQPGQGTTVTVTLPLQQPKEKYE
ncbi:MAG: ATP-binding protein, partial [Desulfohalobiaceae bacterium]